MKKLLFLLVSLPLSLWSQNIDKLEYFFDSDPGVGMATEVTVTAAMDIANMSFAVDVSSLSIGFHTLFTRSRDATGKWSETSPRPFYKVGTSTTGTLPTIDKIEYFVDTDPGVGEATNVPVTAATAINNFDFPINISSISTGFHTIFVRSRDATGKWSETINRPFFKPAPYTMPTLPAIDKVEYFVESDPGVGAATDVPVTAATDINNFTFSVNSAVTIGFHTIYTRTRDVNGKWSETTNRNYYKTEAVVLPVLPTITKVEYFFDTNRDYGMGIDVPVTAALDLTNLSFTPDVSALTIGFHTLFIRSQDANGKWSETVNRSVYKAEPYVTPTLTEIVKIEYFIDADPGYGNGFYSPISGTNVSNFQMDIDISVLSQGYHRLYIRSQNAAGQWSEVANRQFLKSTGYDPTVRNINKAEYFFDSDPGFGLATNIALANASTIPLLNFTADVSALPIGWHTLFARSKDDGNRWSETTSQAFYKSGTPPLSPAPTITKVEYFIDFDPGHGNGIDVPGAATADITRNINIDVSALSNGHHRLGTRSRNVNLQWSETSIQLFVVNKPLPTIDRVEYFVDTDPGFGNGTGVSITAGIDIANQPVNVDISSFAGGFHTLFSRSRTTDGQWSETANHSFYKAVSPLSTTAESIDKIEYFVDSDPGFGNGTNVPVTAATTIANFNFPVSMIGVLAASRTLYVRSRDANGRWSETANVSFTNNATISFATKALLQGAYNSNTGLMTDNLRSLNLIPLTEPYSALSATVPSFTHVNGGGNETVSAPVLAVTGNNAIVDWVFLELRDAANPATVIATRSALLQRDGDIVATDGVSQVAFNTVMAGNYYIVVQHRNHIAVRSNNFKKLTVGTPNVMDFTNNLIEALATPSGTAYNALATTVDNKYVMWGGDANGDKSITKLGSSASNNDYAAFTNYLNGANRILNVYRREDFNLDGSVSRLGSTKVNNDYAMFKHILGVYTSIIQPIF